MAAAVAADWPRIRNTGSIRTEPYAGARIEQQLDDQARKFLNGPNGVRLEKKGGVLNAHTSKVMDWFEEDFDQVGGVVLFLINYASTDKRRQLEAAGNQVKIVFDDYSWQLNDASR